MTIREKLEEIINNEITTARWVCVYSGNGNEQGMSLNALKNSMSIWEDKVLESELISNTFGIRNGENCIFLQY